MLDDSDVHHHRHSKAAVGGVAAAVGLGVWGVAGEDHTTRTDTGAIVEAGDLGAFATRLGDCFDGLPIEDVEVTTVTGLPCTNAHHWQVVYKAESALEEFSQSAIDSEVRQICESAVSSIADGLSQVKAIEIGVKNLFL